MTPRQFSIQQIWSDSRESVFVLSAHDANTKSLVESADYARPVVTWCYIRLNLLPSWCLTCTGRGQWRSWSSGRGAREGCRTDTPWGTWKGKSGTIRTLRWAIGINTHNPRKIVILKMLTKKMVTKNSEETNIFFHLCLLQTIRCGCWQEDRFIAHKRLAEPWKHFRVHKHHKP